MVECEFTLALQACSDEQGFNRYMVECESWTPPLLLSNTNSFNRYMVECESDMTNTLCIIIDVLIDTWWNVNTNNESAFFNFSSFNRYMVECEYICQTSKKYRRRSFNRYMVECELLAPFKL